MAKIFSLVGMIIFFRVIRIGWSQGCLDTGWEKIIDMKPESINSSSVLYVGMNSQGLVNTCFERCKNTNCKAFVIDTARSGCFSVQPDGDDLVPEPNVTFYHKICIKVPSSCKQSRLWQVERAIGAILIDTNTDWLPKLMTRGECYETCFQAGERCKSAQFRTSRDLAIGDTVGKCSLSSLERGIRPQAYRASWYRDEYLQSQCHNISKVDYCSYAEYRNLSLPLSDLKVPDLDIKQCEERCDQSTDGFVCRSYTIITDPKTNRAVCLLQSEDTISAGASSLVSTPGAIYKEREPCLDLKVRCTNSSMIVELGTSEPFHGRIYASGFSDSCGIQGNGNNMTKLSLPIPKVDELMTSNMNCGLAPAFSIDSDNQTHAVVWSTIIVQFNPIIQRQGDQAVRVGCSLEDGTMPEPRNISVHSSFTFLDPNAGIPPIISTVVNTSSQTPTVRMKILDEFLREARVTKLGQKLILKIEIQPSNGTYDIKAGHLVASSASGDASILLLDEMGCPIDSNVFPSLMKDPIDNRSLIGEFSAFRFPNSQQVGFSVIVKFCLEKCEPTVCKSRQISYGRRRRAIITNSTDANVHQLNEDPGTIAPDELPLQSWIYVEDDNIQPDYLLSRQSGKPDTFYISNGGTLEDVLCMNSVLVFCLLIVWLIIQIILIACCVIAILKYRKLATKAEEDRADILARHLYGIHGGNFEISRRVRWADHNGSSAS